MKKLKNVILPSRGEAKKRLSALPPGSFVMYREPWRCKLFGHRPVDVYVGEGKFSKFCLRCKILVALL